MHDGRLMRYHKAATRTLSMLMAPAVPLRTDGALNLCADCQRLMWFAGGYLEMLAQRLSRIAELVGKLHSDFLPNVKALKVGEQCSTVTRGRERAVVMAKNVATERGWTILIQRRGHELLIITRES